ncbi:MAG: glycosyltransferase [Anaerolineae bacterium]|jgi:undecaprenyl-phosphate 4-deoxy-4-formamido-L-arabinose transferase|nr:glycosyltransferase [Anaerolineae bacterium]MBT4309405.1 glycosyltransferase [Anaerolineae bacterium]MBT4458051.1 glycosyltransferase [Anaerolineae bacterium]MBT6062795.1 glycosyltransferase [Anaerolineae bacterium]MBT6321976.1 glycosyltransferase [Anaerolineae bacterium]
MQQLIPFEKGLSVVIPVYKSEKILPFLVESLKKSLNALGEDYEVILVVDGSPDGSWGKILELRRNYAWLRGIHLMRNYGQHNALLQGIRAATYDTIITMDDDLQHPPKEIHKLLAELEKGYDVVYGYPEKETHLLWRNFSSRLMKQILRISLGVVGIEKSGAFRAFRTSLRNGFADYSSSFISIDVLLTWGTTRFGYIPVQHASRKEGDSNYTFRKLILHTFNLITGFSTLPIQLASWLGFGLTFFGLGIFLYVIIRFFLQGSPVPGFPFLASIIAIFSGAQLFAMGIFGEYLSRMYFRLMGKPQSLIRDEVGFQHKKEE